MDENSSKSILGYVSIVPKGAYRPTATYNRLNVVSYEGGSFMLISPTPVTGVTPVDGPVWLQLCEKGEGVTVTSQDVSYATSDQGTTPPESGWQPSIPDVTAGNYLWTEIATTYSDGSEYNTYMVTRFGIDGTGAVSSVNGVSPDATGNVKLDIGSIATIDNTPTINSQNLVTSGGVYSRINAVLSSTQVKIASATISLPAGAWSGSGPYQQTVSIPTAGAKSQINIAAPFTAVAAAVAGGYSVVIANASGVFTAYAIGNKPGADLSLPVTLIQLDGASGTIYGNPLNGAAGLTVDSISAGLGYNPGMVNPNLLDNWYFGNPVNQRGQTSYETESDKYSIDRWVLRRGVITAQNGAINIKFAGTTTNKTVGLYQKIPGEIVDIILGKPVTFSALVDDELYVHTWAAPFAGENNHSFRSDFQIILNLDPAWGAARPIIMFTNSTSGINIKAAKLELGSVQTLARQVDGEWVLNEIPDYGEQLAKCQRYFRRIIAKGSYADFGHGSGINETSARIDIPITIPMRVAQPGIAYSGNYEVIGASSHSVTSLAADQASDLFVRLTATTSGITAGEFLILRAKNDVSAYIDLIADL